MIDFLNLIGLAGLMARIAQRQPFILSDALLREEIRSFAIAVANPFTEKLVQTALREGR